MHLCLQAGRRAQLAGVFILGLVNPLPVYPMQAGEVQHFGMLRHNHPQACGVESLAMYSCHPYDVGSAVFPDISTDGGLEEL